MAEHADRVTLLAGGNAVYVYAGDARTDARVAARVAAQRMILDVAYPATDTAVSTIEADKWPRAAGHLREVNIEIVDTRAEAP